MKIYKHKLLFHCREKITVVSIPKRGEYMKFSKEDIEVDIVTSPAPDIEPLAVGFYLSEMYFGNYRVG